MEGGICVKCKTATMTGQVTRGTMGGLCRFGAAARYAEQTDLFYSGMDRMSGLFSYPVCGQISDVFLAGYPGIHSDFSPSFHLTYVLLE